MVNIFNVLCSVAPWSFLPLHPADKAARGDWDARQNSTINKHCRGSKAVYEHYLIYELLINKCYYGYANERSNV